jgi:hypothetical protein
MESDSSRYGSIALAALVVLSGLAVVATGGGLAATIDTETTDTSTQSDLTDSTVITDYNGSDPGYAFEASVQTQNDSEFRVLADGVVIETWGPTDLNQTGAIDTGSDGNADTWYYRASSSEVNSALQKVPIMSGENATVTFRAVDNATLSAENETYADANVTVDNVDGRIIFRGSAGAMTLEDAGGFEVFGLSILDTSPIAELSEDNVAINGSGTTMTLSLTEEGDNTSIAERFSNPIDSASSGDVVPMQLWVNNIPHQVYYESAPSDVDNSTTYGIFKPDSNEVTANIGDEYDGEDSVDVRFVGGQDFSLWTKAMNLGTFFGLEFVPFLGSMTTFGASLLLFGRTRRREMGA